MTLDSKSYLKLFIRNAFIILFVLAGFYQLSLWAERKSAEVEGPSRLLRGPHDTIYVRIDRSIAKVSSDGELLGLLDLDLDASVPDVADFFVEQDGSFLFARRDSGLLQRYSPEGKLLATLLRIPPPRTRGDHTCSLARDPVKGVLYFADTPRHQIRIFGPDLKELNTITIPSGAAASLPGAEESGDLDLDRIYSSRTPLRYPGGLTFAGDRLIAADTGNSRIVVFNTDGTLDKMVPVFPLESTTFIHPVKVDRLNDSIYAVVRGPGPVGGKVEEFEFHTSLPREFRYSGSSDPWDILARGDDVLVADRASLSVMRYSHTGRFLGTFGRPGLQGLYAGSMFKRKTYQGIRTGSRAGMAAVFCWLLFTGTRMVAALRDVLGPSGSVRRKVPLLVPGLGQAAAGRPVRAGILLAAFLYFAWLFISSLLRYHFPAGASQSLQELITTGFMVYTAWTAVVLDGIRLAGKPADNENPTASKRIRLAAAPLISVWGALAAQITRDAIVHGYPGAPPAVQQLFSLLVTSVHGPSSLSAPSLSASIVFGWGGTAAALFGTFAWEEKSRRSEIATAVVVGFLAGIYTWLSTTMITGAGLGWELYAPLIQGVLLGLSAWLYFRRKGMPLLIVPAAVAGAWIGYFFRFFFEVLAGPIQKVVSEGDPGGLWTGALARLELILMPAYFIHLAIRITWSIASDRPAETAEAENRKEEAFHQSSGNTHNDSRGVSGCDQAVTPL